MARGGQPGNFLSFILLGQAERSYTIQASTDFVTWTTLTNFAGGTGAHGFAEVAVPNAIGRFYRAVTP